MMTPPSTPAAGLYGSKRPPSCSSRQAKVSHAEKKLFDCRPYGEDPRLSPQEYNNCLCSCRSGIDEGKFVSLKKINYLILSFLKLLVQVASLFRNDMLTICQKTFLVENPFLLQPFFVSSKYITFPLLDF